jgi:hypothetical protein
MAFITGDVVIAALHSPRERLLGVVEEIGAAGVVLRSIDLEYFDDWCRAIVSGEDHLTMNENFYPLWRVERMTKDDISNGIPSMSEQFRSRTGMELTEQ